MSSSGTAYASSLVYIGVWINWSKGNIHGATLTLYQREAGLLAAFLAIYVTVAGGQFWRILCYLCYQNWAGGLDHEDRFRRIMQVILRNSGGPASAVWEFALLPLQGQGRDRTPRKTLYMRCTFYIFIAFVVVSSFGAASIFSSQVTKATGNSTLLYSKNCGYARYPDGFDPSFSKFLRTMKLAQDAAGYARACYGSTDNLLQCNSYPQKQIKWQTNTNASCPFSAGRCLNNLAVSFDTGPIDTHEIFGLNAPPKNRITYRRVTTCAPLVLDDISRMEQATDGAEGGLEDVENVYAGPVGFGFGTINATAPTFSRNIRAPVSGVGYQLQTAYSIAGSATGIWVPIPDLNRTDADVTMFLLAFNDIVFNQPNDDAVFSAHVVKRSPLGIAAYGPDQTISAVACAEQHQYCNPAVAGGESPRCTNLTGAQLLWPQDNVPAIQLIRDTGLSTVRNDNLGFTSFQALLAGYSSAATSAGMYFAVFSRGAAALRASETVYSSLQGPLSSTQWITELSGWFAVGLAAIQQAALEYATGPQYLGTTGELVLPAPNDSLGQRLCHSQTFRSSGEVQSFSLLGVVVILVVGGIIMLVSFCLEAVVGWVQQRLGRGQARHAQWERDDKLQLLARESRGGVGPEVRPHNHDFVSLRAGLPGDPHTWRGSERIT